MGVSGTSKRSNFRMPLVWWTPLTLTYMYVICTSRCKARVLDVTISRTQTSESYQMMITITIMTTSLIHLGSPSPGSSRDRCGRWFARGNFFLFFFADVGRFSILFRPARSGCLLLSSNPTSKKAYTWKWKTRVSWSVEEVWKKEDWIFVMCQLTFSCVWEVQAHTPNQSSHHLQVC